MLKMVAAIFATLTMVTYTADLNTTTSEDYIPSESTVTQKQESIELESNLLTYVDTDSLHELDSLIQECNARMENSHAIVVAARNCGYDLNHPVVELALKEYNQAYENYLKYQEKCDLIFSKLKNEEYQAAFTIWHYLKELGYNDYVCAGILGNLMVEVGGQTLDIQYWLGDGEYNGMCQWSTKYYGDIPEDLIGQCDLLANTIKENFDIFGSNYKSNFGYEDFLNLKDEKEAALAFAMCYERCNSKYYDIRLTSATDAYNYFVD